MCIAMRAQVPTVMLPEEVKQAVALQAKKKNEGAGGASGSRALVASLPTGGVPSHDGAAATAMDVEMPDAASSSGDAATGCSEATAGAGTSTTATKDDGSAFVGPLLPGVERPAPSASAAQAPCAASSGATERGVVIGRRRN